MPVTATLLDLAKDLSSGKTTSRALVETCLERIKDPTGEGKATFTKVHEQKALSAADAMDKLRSNDLAPSAFAGIPISVKDLFDLAGDVTTAGSKVLSDAPAANRDAEAIARLKRAGFVVIGRSNMTEFAFSGLGINPHYGTPRTPWDRKTSRIPGGSSSGAAVSVADQMAYGGIGTDTGGSCRIPAAFCGIVGFKPTVGTIPADNILPLSTTLDSAGPLANSVSCCDILYRIMAGADPLSLSVERNDKASSVKGLRIAVPQTLVFENIDETVAQDFEAALQKLANAGAIIFETPMAAFGRIGEMNSRGALPAIEGYAWHRKLLAEKSDDYDPRVSARLANGAKVTAADYISLLEARAAFVAEATEEIASYDVLAMPTVPIVAPAIDDLAEDEPYGRINLLALRNPTTINLMDGCAISLPMHQEGSAPTGLMLTKGRGMDRQLLNVSRMIETVLNA